MLRIFQKNLGKEKQVMPYIPQSERDIVDHALGLLVKDLGEAGFTDGQLNYVVTTLVLNKLGDEPRYADYNAAIGVLECAKLELYRKFIAFYEELAIRKNGDL